MGFRCILLHVSDPPISELDTIRHFRATWLLCRRLPRLAQSCADLYRPGESKFQAGQSQVFGLRHVTAHPEFRAAKHAITPIVGWIDLNGLLCFRAGLF